MTSAAAAPTTSMCAKVVLVLTTLLVVQVNARAIETNGHCSFQSGDYSLSWQFDELSSDVVFKLQAKSKLTNFWSGVYFGDETPTDAIGVFVRAGQIGLVDAHVTADGIESDETTNVQSLAFDLQDGQLTAEFARPITSSDGSDADLADCITFFFPTSSPAIDIGGPIDVPSSLEKRRVCNIAASCAAPSDSAGLVKREDSGNCAYVSDNKKKSMTWHKQGDDVIFSVEQPVKKGKWWSAIAVGESMQDLDIVMAFLENGKVKQTAGYKSTVYGAPDEDRQLSDSHQLLTSANKDDVSSFQISIPIDVLAQKMQENCVVIQLGILSGNWKGKEGSFQIQKHKETPLAITICDLDKCSATESEPAAGSAEASGNKEHDDESATEQEGHDTEEEGEESKSKEADAPSDVLPVVDSQTSDENNVNENQDAPQENVNKGDEESSFNSENLKDKPVDKVGMAIGHEIVEGSGQGGIFENAMHEIESQGSGEQPRNETSEEASVIVDSNSSSDLSNETSLESGQLEDSENAIDDVINSTVTSPSNSILLNQTIEGSGDAENIDSDHLETIKKDEVSSEDTLTSSKPLENAKCDQEDLKVCQVYFDDYLDKVGQWAQKHHHTAESQQWKACKLLTEVKHVKTLCCHRFSKECDGVAPPEVN